MFQYYYLIYGEKNSPPPSPPPSIPPTPYLAYSSSRRLAVRFAGNSSIMSATVRVDRTVGLD
jgi:hypothetical protein